MAGIVCATDATMHATLLDWLRSGWGGHGQAGGRA
jgi:hypothetical protein